MGCLYLIDIRLRKAMFDHCRDEFVYFSRLVHKQSNYAIEPSSLDWLTADWLAAVSTRLALPKYLNYTV